MNLFYRGYVIHQDIPSICYTIFSRRPERVELAACGTSREAMRWVDLHTMRWEPSSDRSSEMALI
jgi:hypothetical protein